MTARSLVCALIAASALIAARVVAAEPPVRVHDAWVADAPPVSRVRAGYLRLENVSDREMTLVGAGSPLFARVEVHRSEVRGGVARMSPVERLVIGPGQNVVFEPGGYHLMLLDPRSPLAPGESVPITLNWEGGQQVEVAAPVRSARGSDSVDHDQHHH